MAAEAQKVGTFRDTDVLEELIIEGSVIQLLYVCDWEFGCEVLLDLHRMSIKL